MVEQKKLIRKGKKSQSVRCVHPHAAGIDLGSREHYAAVGPDKSDDSVRKFSCYTDGLRSMADWLKSHGIKTVAMEATGVYWIPVYQVLESAGFEVVLVNAQHFKCVPGRKTDVQDCQWLQHLHECGLLRGSFRPEDAVVVLRSYVRQRDALLKESSRHIQRMHKALEQMNLQIHKALSDITGESGMAIIKAILSGERDPEGLARHRNYRVKKSHAEVVSALTGDFREEHLFCLGQEVELYEKLQESIAACEAKMEEKLGDLTTQGSISEAPPPKNQRQDKPLRLELFRVTGADLTAIDGMSTLSVLQIISEVGFDMSQWPTEKHFASWLRLCPNNRITGGRIHSGKTLPSKNRAAAIFRKCAENLARSQSYLGAFYRRKRAHRGGPHAVVATAHKLAKLFYRTLKYGEHYVDKGAAAYDASRREQKLRHTLRSLKELGYDVTLEEIQALT